VQGQLNPIADPNIKLQAMNNTALLYIRSAFNFCPIPYGYWIKVESFGSKGLAKLLIGLQYRHYEKVQKVLGTIAKRTRARF